MAVRPPLAGEELEVEVDKMRAASRMSDSLLICSAVKAGRND